MGLGRWRRLFAAQRTHPQTAKPVASYYHPSPVGPTSPPILQRTRPTDLTSTATRVGREEGERPTSPKAAQHISHRLTQPDHAVHQAPYYPHPQNTPKQTPPDTENHSTPLGGTSKRTRELAHSHRPPQPATGPPHTTRLQEVPGNPCATLIIFGDRDVPGIRLVAQQLHTKIPRSELIEIHGADHIVNMSKPNEFNRVVLEFLKKRREQ